MREGGGLDRGRLKMISAPHFGEIVDKWVVGVFGGVRL